MIKRDDIIWLAGLLEGEAWFGLKEGKYPIITLGMTDEDVVVKVAALIKSRVNHRGNVYSVRVHGFYAIQWMMTLYTLLGKRRKEKITSIIKFWREHLYGRMPNGDIFKRARSMAKCHPERLMKAHNLCNSCYMIKWKKDKRLLKLAS